MDSTLIFVCILALIIYTLYWTYLNDFGLFLFILLILLTGIFIIQYISEQVIYYEDIIKNIINNLFIYYKDKIKDIINEQKQNINKIKSNMSEQMLNLKNI
jgi:hypothetical protein